MSFLLRKKKKIRTKYKNIEARFEKYYKHRASIEIKKKVYYKDLRKNLHHEKYYWRQ